MRSVSLLLAAEDNPLVKKFLDNVYPHLPDDLKGYYNQSFDFETDFHKTVEEVKRNMLSCNELTTQPDFDIDLTINTLDELISVGLKMLEYVKGNGLPKDITIDGKSKEFEAFRIPDETLSVSKKLNLPDDLFSKIFFRAYCEYLKAEALKQPSEQSSENYPSSFYPFIKEGLLIPSKEGLVSTCLSVRDLIFRMTETGYNLPSTKEIHAYVVQARICTEDTIKQYRKEANKQYPKRQNNRK